FREGRWEGYPRSIFVLPLREIMPWDACWGATFLLPLKLCNGSGQRGIGPIQSDQAIKLADPENTSQYIPMAYFLVG
ncbi:MAG TPA: hypothetical protein VN935_04945, partial [Rhizomicrobium sp.]|nr:hypothetical protein [Rhizomicrobium sp.]